MKSVMSVMVLLPLALPASAGEKASPIGKKIDDFKLRDYRGAERSFREFAQSKLVVVAFMGTECPVAKLYGPRLAELAHEFEPKGVAFIGISANQQDSVSALGRYARTSSIDFPILKDVGNVVADRFGAVRTPEVFVLDRERVIRYWGRIDDQYGVGYLRPKPVRRDLAVALEELLAGKPVSVAVTEVPGCFIGRVPQEVKGGEVTNCKHIAPILQSHCVECHRPGQIGPFSLTSYEEVVGWTETIREVIRDRRMPPWHADPKYGKFANDSRLPEAERQLLFKWIDNGAPEGDRKDLPKPVTLADGWRIPKPDVVLSIPKSFKVPARGAVPYEFIVVDPGFKEDKWIKAAEIRPGCRPAVHHVLVFIQPPNSSGIQGRRGFIDHWLAGTVPGARPMILPDGCAKFVPAGSRLLFQVHYTPTGSPQTDQTSLGLVFADPKTVRKEVKTEMVVNPKFVIPPHAENYRIEAEDVLEQDTVLLALMPHTHVRGKAFRFEAIYEDGRCEVLLDVPGYDFNWQNSYVLAEPKLLPKGTQVHCVALYDNSTKNPSNPNPNAEVKWGDQTWEEMMIGYFDTIPADQDLLKNPRKSESVVRKETVQLDPQLADLARHALDSQKAFDAFAAAVRKAVPKVDRVCLTSYSGDKLRVESCAYPGKVFLHLGETGFERPGRGFALVAYALLNQFISQPDLKKARGLDMTLLGQTLASSAHVPVALEGKPATLNFWSKETHAFSEESERMFRGIAKAMFRP